MGRVEHDVITVGAALPQPLRGVADALLGLRGVAAIHRAAPAGLVGAPFVDWVLREMGVQVVEDPGDRVRIPTEGPLLVVANHPFGGIEGLVLARTLLARRPDAKVMANYMLGRIPQLRELFLDVDPFDGDGAQRRNVAPLRRALRHLQRGAALAVFPAGEVAHLARGARRVEDPPWNAAPALLARRCAATVVPVWFPGRNGALFQLAGLLHPRLRTALLARALLARRRRPIEIRVGSAVGPRQLARLRDDVERTAYLRSRSEVLAARDPHGPVQPRRTPARVAPLATAVPARELAAEVASLGPEHALVDAGELQVVVARADRIPLVLAEIGRLREMTFRAVGEGTGRATDLDRFDESYRHLFLWSPGDRRVVGAYRLGATDELLERHGPRGLYTTSLFDYDRRIWPAMGPALEMGRSFVIPDAQRSFTPLMLLWKGIGAFVARLPRYATLFGPVSISADYRDESQRMIVSFLERNRFAHDWSGWVRPRRPFDGRRQRGTRPDLGALRDLDDVSSFIAEIEADQKGVPVLLKQYLKLGGRLLGFNVDPEFSDVLDVLLLVDLRGTERRILSRYMGRADADAFLAHHAGTGDSRRTG